MHYNTTLPVLEWGTLRVSSYFLLQNYVSIKLITSHDLYYLQNHHFQVNFTSPWMDTLYRASQPWHHLAAPHCH